MKDNLQGANRIYNALVAKPGKLLEEMGAGIVYATVLAANPIKLQVDGTNKVVTSDFIITSPFCWRHEHDNYVPTYQRGGGSGYAEYASHNHDYHYGGWRELQEGDRVVAFMSSDKQMYCVLWRIGMIFGDMGGG